MATTDPRTGRREAPLLRRASDAAWRLLVLLAAAALLLLALNYLRVVVIPVILATFITAILMPPALWLRRSGLPWVPEQWRRAVATTIVSVGAIVLATGVVWALVPPTVDGFDELGASVGEAITEIETLLGTLGLDDATLSALIGQAQTELSQNAERIATGALQSAVVVGEIVVGLILTLVLVVYFLHGGDRLFAWVLELFPRVGQGPIRRAGRLTWEVSARYVRGIAIVGLFNSVVFGICLVLLGVPLALPLAVLTFIGAFLPIVGAFLSGLLAALVAFVAHDWLIALAVIAAAVLVQQLEGHLLAPRVYGRALDLPSVVVLLAIAGGTVIGGILGAFLAAPVSAVVVALLHSRPFSSDGDDPVATPAPLPEPAEEAVPGEPPSAEKVDGEPGPPPGPGPRAGSEGAGAPSAAGGSTRGDESRRRDW
ncbi:AI-2E family transporter [Allonocardiopsis opalescens]|uniref:Putative PurR-regulated permease PerM n=1 Tax=Allonocardiopsis opalescens TaxID=1144618 RepID=A0A2T0Q455_9ACTN|nr:AI-2E family transporter [Allonocardiopsis opalescens]PRX98585.1 putative PurR-regulated permease PerM [Allonocardiopsis opalescens]